ncbi:hypothetical protein BDU57DRAFT_92024 [Ampelomyces quisqualis]|uniref:Uncharacterized protein n=1 Tax=Ampelomyces quisqualis TaxID=50730 RepID=A0A6A5Q9Q5_AMPQU|nr:hypothetical protein BDU57DRAFT_92024 [Ampelomyces quisqualis]
MRTQILTAAPATSACAPGRPPKRFGCDLASSMYRTLRLLYSKIPLAQNQHFVLNGIYLINPILTSTLTLPRSLDPNRNNHASPSSSAPPSHVTVRS